MSIAKKVADLIPSSGPTPAESSEDTEEDTGGTELFECEPCGTTYISETLEECPNCGASVESVRSERDLGML